MVTCDPSKDGLPLIQFYVSLLDDCIYSNLDVASVWLGFANIVLWTFAAVPQMLEVYRTKSVEGLDVRFLIAWLLSDTMAFAVQTFHITQHTSLQKKVPPTNFARIYA